MALQTISADTLRRDKCGWVKPQSCVWICHIGVPDSIGTHAVEVREHLWRVGRSYREWEARFHCGDSSEVPASEHKIHHFSGVASPVAPLAVGQFPNIADSERLGPIEVCRAAILFPI